MKQMLSVKSAIERVVQGQVAVCLAAVAAGTYTREHFTTMAETVEKFIASLYISGQINREFTVETSMTGMRLTVKFGVGEHVSVVDNILPAQLIIRAPRTTVWPTLEVDGEPIAVGDVVHVEFDDYQELVAEFNQQKNLIKEQMLAQQDVNATTIEKAIAVMRESGATEDEVFAFTEEYVLAVDAYERAKKFTAR